MDIDPEVPDENVESQLKTYASYGVTTMQSMGTEQPLILDMRAEQRRTGRPRETRIYTAHEWGTIASPHAAIRAIFIEDCLRNLSAGQPSFENQAQKDL